MTRYNRVQLSPTEKKSEVKGLGRFLGAFHEVDEALRILGQGVIFDRHGPAFRRGLKPKESFHEVVLF